MNCETIPFDEDSDQGPPKKTKLSSKEHFSDSISIDVDSTDLEPIEPIPLSRIIQRKKKRFLMLSCVLMRYLEKKNPAMHTRAKSFIRKCDKQKKKGEKGYESVTACMEMELRKIVGEEYWSRAEAYLDDFLYKKH